MCLVWIVDPLTRKNIPLKMLFDNLQDAFEMKEKLKERYPEHIFSHSVGIVVPVSEMKTLTEVMGNVQS